MQLGASSIRIIFFIVIISISGCQNIPHGLGYGCFLSDKVLITLISTFKITSTFKRKFSHFSKKGKNCSALSAITAAIVLCVFFYICRKQSFT